MSLEQSVSQDYTHGKLETALLDALKRAGMAEAMSFRQAKDLARL